MGIHTMENWARPQPFKSCIWFDEVVTISPRSNRAKVLQLVSSSTKKAKRKILFWEKQQIYFLEFYIHSWADFFLAIVKKGEMQLQKGALVLGGWLIFCETAITCRKSLLSKVF